MYRFRILIDFNPRSHEGSDAVAGTLIIYALGFQSTLPRGERHGEKVLNAIALMISIHAPTRGATILPLRFSFRRRFQSTLPRGERHRA